MTIRPCLYAAAVLILAAGPAAAEMYHWVDGSGVNHYANTPPPAGVKAKSSWAEVRYNAAADAALATENERVIAEGDARDASAAQKTANEAAAGERTLKARIDALERQQAELATSLLSDRYNFRPQANPMRRKIADLDRTLAAAETTEAQAAAAKAERRKTWDALFTERYVVRQGYVIMEQYRNVARELEALGR